MRDVPQAPPSDPLEEARQEFKRWRKRRPHSRSRIPEDLWSLAVQAARTHGLYRTSRALALDYTRLKDRLAQAVDAESRPVAKPGEGFVELAVPSLGLASRCLVELSAPSGATMRIELSGPAVPALAALTRGLLGGDR
ncbi:MAG: hypothetical protein GXP48_09330 [Acidobacteria bacterium]|nr:hypothetical protein [Acidobacteriota bacterium]